MGYQTDFDGQIEIVPALNDEEKNFLTKFNETRRMDCEQGPYYVDRGGMMGQTHGDDVRNFNGPPAGQPGLWCNWVPSENENGDVIEWSGAEKFYESPEWMAYIIEHFLGQNPLAKSELPFLQGHTLNGTIAAQGEDPSDMWLLHVRDNVVSVEELKAVPDGNERVIGGETKLLGNG